MSQNTIEKILSLMQLDNEDPDGTSEILEITSEDAPPEEQKIMDNLMISLCGYSLDTIINHPDLISEDLE